MQRVKFFKGTESDLVELEQEINDWLASNDVQVLNIFGNMSPQTDSAVKSKGLTGSAFPPSDLFLVVVYETDSE